MTRKSFLYLTIWLIISLTLLIKAHRVEISSNINGEVRMSDYAYHMLMFSNISEANKSNIYDYDFQEAVLNREFKAVVFGAMPIGTPPFAAMALARFAELAKSNMRLFQTLWAGISILVFLSACWQWMKHYNKSLEVIIFLYVTLIFVSPIFYRTLNVGQTSIFASGILLHMLLLLKQAPRANHSLKLSIFALLLTIKPTYFLLALAILLIYRKPRASINSAVIVALLCFASLSVFSISDIHSYIQTLRMYSSGIIPYHYASSIVFDRMNNLVVAAMLLMNHSKIALVSNLLFYGGVLLAIGLANWKNFPPAVATIAALSSYLLFCPYLIAEEDIIFSVVLLLTLAFKEGKVNLPVCAFIIAGALVAINHTYLGSNLANMWMFWLIKLAVLLTASLHTYSHSSLQKTNIAV